MGGIGGVKIDGPKVGGAVGQVGGVISGATKKVTDPIANAIDGDPKLKGIFKNVLDKVAKGGLSSQPLPELGRMRQLSDLGNKGVVSATQVSSSPWLQMAMAKQTADQARALDSGMQSQAQAVAQGRIGNIMRGGVKSGSSEMLAGAGMDELGKMRQTQALQNAMGNAGVQMQGAGRETDINKFNAGLTNQALQSNATNQIQDLINQNQNNAYRYGEKMKMKAADATSQGIAASGSGGGGKK